MLSALWFGFNTTFTTHSFRQTGLVRDTEYTERNVLMENREVPILHELPNLFETEDFCLSAAARQTKKSSLRDRRGSVVNANKSMPCLINRDW